MRKKQNTILWILFFAALAGYAILMGILFYRQVIHEEFGFQVYESDVDAYLLEMQGLDSGFDFPYPVYFSLARILIPVMGLQGAATASISILNTLAVLVLFLEMWKTFGKNLMENTKAPVRTGGLLLFACFSLFFISMLFAPKGVYLPGMDHKYLGVFTPNPFHNQTYLAARPFTIAAMFAFARLADVYEKGEPCRDHVLFALYLLLATLTKPSFTLVLGSMAVVMLVGRFIFQKGKTLKATLLMACTFLPTVIALLVQFGNVFGASSHAGEEGGIGFGFFSAWKVYMTNVPLAILLGTAFPLLMLLCNLRRLKDHTFYRLSMALLLTGFLEFALLYEKGDRFIHLNFCWGYMAGLFFAFCASLLLLVENTVLKKQHKAVLVLEWGAFLWHLFCGILYFRFIYLGGFYYSF